MSSQFLQANDYNKFQNIQNFSKTPNSNLKTSTDEVIKQGGQLSNISENLQDAGTHIKATDNTMFVIEWRARCHRIVLYSTIVLEFITIIVLLLYKLLH